MQVDNMSAFSVGAGYVSIHVYEPTGVLQCTTWNKVPWKLLTFTLQVNPKPAKQWKETVNSYDLGACLGVTLVFHV